MLYRLTWDVKSLYTNIPHKEGLEALKITLDNEKIPTEKAETIIEFSKLVITSNHFEFLGQQYPQMSGTAMGTKMALSYANLFMGVLEQQMFSSYKHKPFLYFRYIDDIFMIWTDGEDSLNDFLTHCNNQNKNIQFQQIISSTSIPFLDVSVTLEHGKLTDLYTKSTNKHQYLHHTSCHPKHTKTSLPYCLALRLHLICSSEKPFHHRNETTPYPKRIQAKNHTQCNQESLLSYERRSPCRQNHTSRVPFLITYNPMLQNIPKILHDSQPILHASERRTQVFKNVPLVSYRQARNLSDMLCSKHIAPPESSNPNPAPIHQINSGYPPANTN